MRTMQKTILAIGLILSVSSVSLGQEKAITPLPRVSEKTRAEWQARYDLAANKKLSGWIYFAAGVPLITFGAWDYSSRFDEVVVPGDSYDVIRCSGGVCLDTVVREPSTLSKVENPGRRNLAIASLAGGAALSIWGLSRIGSAATEMRNLEDQRRNWGSVILLPGRAGRGWLICYQRTF